MLQIQDDPFSPERVELHPLAVVQAPGALHPLRELQVQRIVQTGSVSFDVPCGALRKDRAYTQIGPMLKGYPADTLEEHLSDEAQTFAWKPSCHAAEDTAQITLENSYATCRFPYNATGFLCMTVECAQACTVYLLFDEILTDGDVDFLRLTNCNCFKYDLDAGTHRIMTFAPYTMMYLKIAAKGACRVSEVRMLQYQHPAPEFQIRLPEQKQLREVVVEEESDERPVVHLVVMVLGLLLSVLIC